MVNVIHCLLNTKFSLGAKYVLYDQSMAIVSEDK